MDDEDVLDRRAIKRRARSMAQTSDAEESDDDDEPARPAAVGGATLQLGKKPVFGNLFRRRAAAPEPADAPSSTGGGRSC